MNGTSTTQHPGAPNRGALVGGLIMVMVGIGILLAEFTNIGGGAVVAGIGLAFLTAFAFTRNYGFLVPGCILSGLGAGITAEEFGVMGEPVVLGLGLGFIAIWLLDITVAHALPPSGNWWPLIPGGILTLVGVIESVPNSDVVGQYLWPIGLIVAGGIIILASRRR